MSTPPANPANRGPADLPPPPPSNFQGTLSASQSDGEAGASEADLPSIPGYRLVKVLGRGGMGVVYWAWQAEVNRPVALKMLLKGLHATAKELLRFRIEAEAAARMQHPNITQIYEVGEHDGCPYFSLEYLDGGSLADHLDGNPWPIARAVGFLAVLADAAHYAHQRGVIHRDLKPANILLAADGTPKIADFGLAKLTESETDNTRTGAILGSPCYMAPEQADGRTKTAGPAADVYALGSMLYQLLTGRPPLHGETPMDTLVLVRTQDPVPPSRLQPKIPRDLETICLKCLEKDPAKRYPEARELAEELRRFQAGEPLQTRPLAPFERVWRWCRRNPKLAAAGGLAAAAVVAVVAVSVAFGVVQSRANTEIRAAYDQATGERRLMSKLSAELLLDRGQALGEAGDVPSALLWMARGLETLPDGEADLADALRRNITVWRGYLGPIRERFDHPAEILAAAFSPDGKLLALGGQDQTVRLWSVAERKPVGPPLKQTNLVRALSFSRDGALLLVRDESVAGVWDVSAFARAGAQVAPAKGRPVGAALSADNRSVILASAHTVSRVDAATGDVIGTLLTTPRSIRSMTVSPDERTIVTGCEDGGVLLWDAATGEPREAANPALLGIRHARLVGVVEFSHDGRVLLTGSDDQTVRLWDAATGAPLGQPLPHQHRIRAASFSPDGTLVAIGTDHFAARLWDTRTGKPLGVPFQHHLRVRAVAFSPDGRTVVTGSRDETAVLWDVPRERPTTCVLRHQDWVRAVAFSPDGGTIATSSRDARVALWAAATGEPRPFAVKLAQDAPALAFSPDGRTLLTGSRDGTVRLWDADTGKPVGQPLACPDAVWAAAFSPDGDEIMVGTQDGTVSRWGTTADPLARPPFKHGESSWVRGVAYSPDRSVLATAGDDGCVRFRDAPTGAALPQVLAHPKRLRALAFSPDGRFVVTGGDDKAARLWDWKRAVMIGPPMPHQDVVAAVGFTPDGLMIFTGSWDGTSRLWHARTGKPIGPAFPAQEDVYAVAISPDGRFLLSGSRDKEAVLWAVPADDPVPGDVPRVRCWITTLTRTDLDQHGMIRGLDREAWEEKRRQLDALGGAPAARRR